MSQGRFLGEVMVDDTETLVREERWFCPTSRKLYSTANCVHGDTHARVKRLVTPWVYDEGHGDSDDSFLERVPGLDPDDGASPTLADL